MDGECRLLPPSMYVIHNQFSLLLGGAANAAAKREPHTLEWPMALP